MFIATSFTIVKMWSNPSVQWVSREAVWCPRMGECSSALGRGDTPTGCNMDGPRGHYAK